MGFGTRNAEGERILEFGDAVGMVVCNTFFKKEDSKLITYQSGENRIMIDHLIVRKTDRCLVKDVKVISSEQCVPQHRSNVYLLCGDIVAGDIEYLWMSPERVVPLLVRWKRRLAGPL